MVVVMWKGKKCEVDIQDTYLHGTSQHANSTK